MYLKRARGAYPNNFALDEGTHRLGRHALTRACVPSAEQLLSYAAAAARRVQRLALLSLRQTAQRLGAQIEVTCQLLLRQPIRELRVLAEEALQTTGSVQQVKRNHMRHDLAHEAHDFIFKIALRVGVALNKCHPLRQR